MKRTKKLLALALALILALSLAPAAAGADPPDTECPSPRSSDGHHDWRCEEYIPPTCTEPGYARYFCYDCLEPYEETIPPSGHDWTEWWWSAVDQNVEPTCTEPGSHARHCDKCGLTEVETLPPLGHDWDAGLIEVNGEGLLVSRTIRHTCQRCGEVWIETDSSLDTLFQQLRRPSQPEDPVLIVTLQPQGGSITRGETYTMIIEVEGGEEPYSYEWHRVDKEIETPDKLTEHILEVAGAELEDAVARYLASRSRGRSIARSLMNRVPGFSAQLAEPAAVLASEGSFNSQDHNVGPGDGPSFTADRANCEYYCVITDAAGNRAVTDSAEVYYHVRIVEQPRDLNVQEGGAFTVSASDGLPPYQYQWCFINGNTVELTPIPGASDARLDASQVPENAAVCCVVTDAAGDSAASLLAFSFSADPLELAYTSPTRELAEGESLLLEARFRGGVAPYTATWFRDGEELETQLKDLAEFSYTAEKPGNYTCLVRDGADRSCTGAIAVLPKQLEILRQPESGNLDDKGVFIARLEVGNGEPPFTYTLSGFGSEDAVFVGEGQTPSFTITLPGKYWVVVEDANGARVKSDYFTVDGGDLRVLDTSGDYVLKFRGEVCVNWVRAAGGTKPYTYDWTWVGESGRMQTWEGNAEEYLFAIGPGWYYCTVRDANGSVVNPPGMRIGYSGEEPYIVIQPVTTVTRYDGPGPVLYCEAVSGAGNNSGLLYRWSVKHSFGWTRVSESPDGSYSVPNEYLGRVFRCTVFDTLTGKWTFSNEVMAYDELACVTVETVDSGGYSRWLFTGGVGPYTVTVTCYDPYANSNDAVNQVLKTYTVNSLGWLGYSHPRTTTAGYTMTIRDALGQEVSEMAPIRSR